MNYRSITYILGWIMRVEGVFLLLPVIVALIYGEDIWTIYLVCAFLTLAIGVLLSLKRSGNFRLFAREGYVSVALGWVVMSLISALPLWITGDIPHFVDALFEINPRNICNGVKPVQFHRIPFEKTYGWKEHVR